MDKDGLIEEIAKGIHNDWVEWRKSLGFSYSEKQDYANKTHPHIRDWNELSEEHKESDYRAAKVVIKILKQRGIL